MSGAFQVQCFADDLGVRWRLLSGNNREIGRGVAVHADERECRAAVLTLRDAVPGLPHRFRPCNGRRWVWELCGDGGPVAVASHSFDRLLRCAASLEVFRSQFVTAVVADAIVDSTVRRWRVDPSVTRRLFDRGAASPLAASPLVESPSPSEGAQL